MENFKVKKDNYLCNWHCKLKHMKIQHHIKKKIKKNQINQKCSKYIQNIFMIKNSSKV
jgi:hypothetical protein